MQSRKAMSLIEVLIVIAIIAVLIGLLLPAIQTVRDSALKTQSSNNLRQIAIAVQSYASVYGEYPADGVKATGHPGLGVMFALLPYLEHGNYYGNRSPAGELILRDSGNLS